jgi:diguanylate cyclase (GGDEF)-like protein
VTGDRTSVDARVRAEQVRVIYQQAPAALLISLLVSAVLCFILWDVTDRARLAGWFVLLAFLALVRIGIVAAFRRRNPDAGEMPVWERRFVVSLVTTGLVWGVGGWLVMPADSLVHQAVVYFFLMGMAGGAVATYSAHAACTYVTIGAVLLPATGWFVLQDDVLLRAMAAGGLVYVGAAYRATRVLSFFLHRSFQLSHELQIANEKAEQLARTDELTGLRNRRAFYEQGELAVVQAQRYGRPLSAVMLDIDHFKTINDTWGHSAGDDALRALAGVITKSARSTDITGRVGGEEFAIVLPETTGNDAAAQAERLRRDVAGLSFRHGSIEITFTCSFGVAELDDSGSLDVLIARADAALYEAKAQGRNRVIG